MPLSGDGDYTVTLFYNDRSGNEMEPIPHIRFIYDSTKPIISLEYDNNEEKSVYEAAAISMLPAIATIPLRSTTSAPPM